MQNFINVSRYDLYENNNFDSDRDNFDLKLLPESEAQNVRFNTALAIVQIRAAKANNVKITHITIPEFCRDNYLCIWTAFLLIGKQYKNLNVNSKNISISIEFDFLFHDDTPDQLGIFGGFKNDSYYERVFKHHLPDGMINLDNVPQAFEGSQYKHKSIKDQMELRKQELKQSKENLEQERAKKLELEKQQAEQKRRQLKLEEQKKAEQKKLLEDRNKLAEINSNKERIDTKQRELMRLLSDPNEFPDLSVRGYLDNLDPNYQDYNGNTPLMAAISTQKTHIAEYILKKGANPQIKNKKGETAIDLISETSPLYELMVKKAKDLKYEKCSAAIKYGMQLHEEIRSPFPKLRKIKEYLILGADINLLNEEGFTPLMVAADAQNDRVVEYLLKQGADPFKSNKYGEAIDYTSRHTALFETIINHELIIATFNNDLCAVQIAINNGASINFRSLGGYTALMIAIEKCNVEIVKFLMSKQADLSVIRDDGLGVFDLVTNTDIYNLLSESTYENEAEYDSDSSEKDYSEGFSTNRVYNFFKGYWS